MTCPTASNLDQLLLVPSTVSEAKFLVLQGTPVCIAFAQHTKQKPALPLGVLDHVTGMHSLHAAAPGLLSVVDISLNDGTGLHEILAWVKAIY